ncbi:exonuclease SbcCD subunit D [Sinomonas sp. R1AF57]|uniref:exonuclease SbcCD subunit D n=1 Tax=Sinomonas sp. R1AF57 TaxID=2020377 RepID=UPI000B612F05|nr:exonuclease SbcCD subunit D [Sinomonas sp. R1AF57]ASN52267.1 exonuclease SbcCD subunit D [Sinomonas sp. R1AF57]
MKILHTSDWHLGRSFHGVGMLAAQAEWLDGLVATVVQERVEAVLVAGDVYDRALPAVDVVDLLDRTLVRLTEAGAQVVISSGNHDSAVRLGFAASLLERGGVHLRTRVAQIGSPVLLPLAGGARVAVYALPYLEPRLVAESLGVASPTHGSVTEAALSLVRADLAERRAAGTVHSVVMAHTFAGGGAASDSERALSVGGLDVVPLAAFDGFDYVALGHLHGRQELSPSIRYSGSPLAYSFSEARQAKGGWMLDVGPAGIEGVEPVGWPTRHRLAVLRGALDDLLSGTEHGHAEDAYCHVTLTDAERPARAMERLRERFPLTVGLAFEPEGGTRREEASYSSKLAAATSDLGVCCGFLDHVRQRGPSEDEAAALDEILEAVRLAEVSS